MPTLPGPPGEGTAALRAESRGSWCPGVGGGCWAGRLRRTRSPWGRGREGRLLGEHAVCGSAHGHLNRPRPLPVSGKATLASTVLTLTRLSICLAAQPRWDSTRDKISRAQQPPRARGERVARYRARTPKPAQLITLPPAQMCPCGVPSKVGLSGRSVDGPVPGEPSHRLPLPSLRPPLSPCLRNQVRERMAWTWEDQWGTVPPLWGPQGPPSCCPQRQLSQGQGHLPPQHPMQLRLLTPQGPGDAAALTAGGPVRLACWLPERHQSSGWVGRGCRARGSQGGWSSAPGATPGAPTSRGHRGAAGHVQHLPVPRPLSPVGAAGTAGR